MLLGVCGAMAGVYDGIVAVPRRSRALYVALGHQHLQAAQAPPCFPPLVMPCHAARCKNVPYGLPVWAVLQAETGRFAGRRGLFRGARCVGVKARRLRPWQCGGSPAWPGCRHWRNKHEKWVFVDRICRLERQLSHLLCIFALNTKIMRYEKGYVKNYIALRYGP